MLLALGRAAVPKKLRFEPELDVDEIEAWAGEGGTTSVLYL